MINAGEPMDLTLHGGGQGFESPRLHPHFSRKQRENRRTHSCRWFFRAATRRFFSERFVDPLRRLSCARNLYPPHTPRHLILRRSVEEEGCVLDAPESWKSGEMEFQELLRVEL